MKSAHTTPPATGKQGQISLMQPDRVLAHATPGNPVVAASLVRKSKANRQRQHAAIAKLLKMCQTSPVVTLASQGITAEVRRDRDRGHA